MVMLFTWALHFLRNGWDERMSDGGNPGCLGAILRLFGVDLQPAQGEGPLPYRVRDDFLSPAELLFYTALKAGVGASAVICPKVNLGDVFFVARPNENQGARARISQKHVDFLLCDVATMKPVCGIELDDSSHNRADRQARDELVNSVFAAAGIPLERFPVRQSYTPQELVDCVRGHLAAIQPEVLNTQPVSLRAEGGSPVCPKCDEPMMLRTASKGGRKGERFWGCGNYPRCRETRPVE